MPPGSFQHAQAGAAAGVAPGAAGTTQLLEEMLWKCPAPEMMWEIVQQYRHILEKSHVAIALYQCGLYRYYQQYQSHERLVEALIDKLLLFPASDLTPDESSRVLWAIALLEETRSNEKAIEYAIQLAGEAIKRYQEFSPAQMARFAASAQKLVRTPEEDEFLSAIISRFSDYALGDGKRPRFPPDELIVWTSFLTSVSSNASHEEYSGDVALAPQHFGKLPSRAAGLPPGAFPPGNHGIPSASLPLPVQQGAGPPGQLGLPNPFLALGMPGAMGLPGFLPSGGGSLPQPGPRSPPGTFSKTSKNAGGGGQNRAQKQDRAKAPPQPAPPGAQGKPSHQPSSKTARKGGQSVEGQQLNKQPSKKLDAATSSSSGAGKASQQPAPADRRPRRPGPVPPGPVAVEGKAAGTAAASAAAPAPPAQGLSAPPSISAASAAAAEQPKTRKGRSKIPQAQQE